MTPKNNNNQGVFLELLVTANFLCLEIRSNKKKKTYKKFFILVIMSKYKL